MKKLVIIITLMLPALLSITAPAIAGGLSASCSFKVLNCLCTKTRFQVYNGNDGSHISPASNYNLDHNSYIKLNCNADNCDTHFYYDGQDYWKNDQCGNIAAYPQYGGGRGVTWLETSSTSCPTYCP